MATQHGTTPDDSGMMQFQIQRGAQAEATDGLIGTVEQIVVDRNTGELRTLVIRAADGRSEFELPAEYVRQSTGDHVYLTLSNEQIANTPHLAQPYDPDQYVPVYEGQMEPAPAATEAAHETGHPIVTDVDTDSARVVLPVTPERSPANQTPATATQAVLSPNQAQPPSPDGTPPATRAPRATDDDEDARTTTPGMYADFTAAPKVVAPFEALPEQGMTSQPGVTNAPVNPTREHTAGGVLQTPITDTPLTPENAGQLTVPEQQALDESQQLFHYDEIYPQEPPRSPTPPAPTTNPATPSADPAAGPLDDTGPLLGKVQPVPPQREAPLTSGYPSLEPPMGLSPAAGLASLAAAGLAVGVGAAALIALLRRRSQPNVARSAASTAANVAETVTSSVGGAASAAQDALKRLVGSAPPAGVGLASAAQAAQDAAGQAARSVTSAGKGAAQTVAEAGQSAGASLAAVNWRPRVFRWGLLLGALAGVFFAPRPGSITRDQLAHQLNRMLSRAS